MLVLSSSSSSSSSSPAFAARAISPDRLRTAASRLMHQHTGRDSSSSLPCTPNPKPKTRSGAQSPAQEEDRAAGPSVPPLFCFVLSFFRSFVLSFLLLLLLLRLFHFLHIILYSSSIDGSKANSVESSLAKSSQIDCIIVRNCLSISAWACSFWCLHRRRNHRWRGECGSAKPTLGLRCLPLLPSVHPAHLNVPNGALVIC